MGYYALACLDDALAATRAFLLPVDRGRWLRLAVVVSFLAGGSSAISLPSSGTNVSPSLVTSARSDLPATLPEIPLALIIGVVVGTVAFVVFYVFGAAVMQFVLVDALHHEQVALVAPIREYVWNGLALFLFQIALGGVTLGVGGGIAFLLAGAAGSGVGPGMALAIVVAGLAVVVVVLAAALVNLLTVDFVVPTMVIEECGLLAGWRRFWPVLRGDLAQFGVYLLVRIGLLVAVGLAASTATGVAGALLAIPFVILAVTVVVVTGFSLTGTTLALFAALALLYLVVLLSAVAVIYVPLQTFVRYYQLFVLGDADETLDLIPQRRATVRDGPTGRDEPV